MTTHVTDYYTVLGIPADAALADIKKAYRTLARRHHPDRNNGDPAAAERFRQITEAYEVLTDPARRQAYDATRPPVTCTTITTPSPDGPAISAVVRVLEDIWAAIRARHGEVPAVVIIIASGTDRKQPVWGHHAPGRWHTGHGQRAEIMISGEGLGRTPQTSSAPCCTRPPTPWPPHAASKTPPARAATTTPNTRCSPKNSASPLPSTPPSAGPSLRSRTPPPRPTPTSSLLCETP